MRDCDRPTPREFDVLELLAAGLTAGGIAQRLGLSEHTVDEYLKRLRRRFGANTQASVVAHAYVRGFLGVGTWPPARLDQVTR